MTSSTPKSGYDAWVDNGHTHTTHGSDDWLQIQNNQKRILVWLPMPDRMVGRTVSSATLTGHAHGSLVGQTFTVKLVTAQWTAGKVTWSNQPATSGTVVATKTITGANDGDAITWDVTFQVQEISGATLKNYGFLITTDNAAVGKFAAFNSGQPSWSLDVEFSENPDAPTSLAPNGTIVGAAKPVVSFDFTEYGADQSDLAKVRVEVDTNGDGTVDWDSGFVTAVTPSLDLAAAGMTGTITEGQTVHWRASVQDTAGNSSVASAWATYTYRALRTLTMNTPAAGVMYDPTSDVIATASGGTGTNESWLIEVTDATDRTQVRYSSGKTQATDPNQIALGLPLKNDDGSRIFTDDQSYQIHVRLWDTYDRQPTPGVASHVDLWTTVTFNDDGALAQVSTFTAAQTGTTPWVQLSWTDTAAPDAYDVTRDDVHIARLLPTDVTTGASSYAWADMGASPAVSHTYKIRRIINGTGRCPAKSATITTNPEGVWLLRDNGDYVVLDGTDGVGSLQILERRLVYTMLNLPYAVDILTQYEGYSSAQPLVFSVEDDEDQTLAHAQNILNAIKRNSTETVQFIAATISKPVRVTDLEIVPDPDYRGDMNRHVVRFNIKQVGDFDYKVG